MITKYFCPDCGEPLEYFIEPNEYISHILDEVYKCPCCDYETTDPKEYEDDQGDIFLD